MKLQELKQLNEGHLYKNIEYFKDLGSIKKFFKDLKIPWTKKITVHPDWTVDYQGDLNFYSSSDNTLKIHKLPIKFGKVTGSFVCSYLELHTLENCPKEVGDGFNCEYNKLVTLEGGPFSVDGAYSCYSNRLKSLKGCPEHVNEFSCGNNELESLKGCPIEATYFDCTENYLTSIDDAPKNLIEFDCSENPIKTLNGIGEIFSNCKEFRFKDYKFDDILNVVLIPGLQKVFIDKNAKAMKIINKYAGKPDQIFECQTELINAGFEKYAQL